jgi:hypothetical protein
MWKNDNKNNPEKPQYYSGTPCTGVLRVHAYRQLYSYSEYSGVPRSVDASENCIKKSALQYIAASCNDETQDIMQLDSRLRLLESTNGGIIEEKFTTVAR